MNYSSLVDSIDWNLATNFWNNLLFCEKIPNFVVGNEQYGLNDLQCMNISNEKECNTVDVSEIRRKTFLLRVGYSGNNYFGFQRQGKKDDTARTVEGDLCNALRTTVASAGRTDRNVSALSQMISVTVKAKNNKRKRTSLEDYRRMCGATGSSICNNESSNLIADASSANLLVDAAITPEFASITCSTTSNEVIQLIKESDAYKAKRLNVFDCISICEYKSDGGKYQCKKEFQTAAQLSRTPHVLYDAKWRRYLYIVPLVTVDNIHVPYCNGRGTFINSNSISNSKSDMLCGTPLVSCKGIDVQYMNELLSCLIGIPLDYEEYGYRMGPPCQGAGSGVRGTTSDVCHDSTTCDPVVRSTNQCDDHTHFNNSSVCTLYHADVSVVPIDGELVGICFEFVGNRFIRRMIRILVATVLREGYITEDIHRDKMYLRRICDSVGSYRNTRIARTAAALPGNGLALCGIGY